MKTKKRNTIEIIKYCFGYLLIFVGVAGLVLPLIPGILLIILGASMLGSRFVLKKTEKIEEKLENMTTMLKAKLKRKKKVEKKTAYYEYPLDLTSRKINVFGNKEVVGVPAR